MQFPNERQLKALRERYPEGTLIRLKHMDDPYAPVPPGTISARFRWSMTAAAYTWSGRTAERFLL